MRYLLSAILLLASTFPALADNSEARARAALALSSVAPMPAKPLACCQCSDKTCCCHLSECVCGGVTGERCVPTCPCEIAPLAFDATGCTWEMHSDGTEAGLRNAQGVQIGMYRFSDGAYRSYDRATDTWGAKGKPPLTPPAKPHHVAQPQPTFQPSYAASGCAGAT
jgi:hypothetical protein